MGESSLSRFWTSFLDSLLSLAFGFGGSLLVIGIPFLLIGMLHDNVPTTSVGLGFISAGAGLVALGLGVISNRRTRAMSSLEFREKIAIMKFHMAKLLRNPLPLSSLEIEGIVQDVRSAFELKKWVKRESAYKDFKNQLGEFINLSGQTGQSNLCERLQELQKEIES